MAKAVESPINAEQLRNASSNYLRCLRLPPSSKVLIITDTLPTTGDIDPHLQTRVNLSTMLRDQIGKEHQVSMIDFGEKPNEEELHTQTERALKELSDVGRENNSESHSATIVYLGNDWGERQGIYKAANEFGETNDVKFAGSLGFTTGDCRVMSQIGESQLETITRTNEYFENFFKEKPQGAFEIITRDSKGIEHKLSLDYHTTRAPFESELGNFDGKHETPLGGYKNVKYINIPGGENYGTPYPFRKANGTFSGEGIIFTVKDGFLVDLEIGEGVSVESLSTSQKELIERTKEAKSVRSDLSGQFLPIAELGLGFYELAGIETYSDSSTLTYEKSGPHIAFGHVAEGSAEQDEIAELSGKFQHSDFVLDHAVITWGQTKDSEQSQFYPPAK